MAHVYVVQLAKRRNRDTGEIEPVFDITPAEEHGELVELLSPTAKPFNPEPIIEELYVKLENYGDDDFILCIGNPILMALACSIAADINDGRVNMLQWNGHQGRYVPVEADIS
jgi:hypothetical protein